MPKVVHFDISALDTKRAIGFYQKTFGWKFTKAEGMDYWMIETGPEGQDGIGGGLGPREKDNYVVNTIQVDNIDKAVGDIKANGGKITAEKAEIPGYGWFAQFEDPEGNLFSVMQFS
jgi:predicted enzyme related to lactoylglutathione lyase